ncbi:MAG: hypothetical protein MJ211_01095 [Bacteroidales bacterium]|nr:hypothetical protein [Bacteroidales bacterium]
MNKIESAKLALAISAVLLSGNAFGQTPEDVVKAKFPETQGDLKITNTTTYNVALKSRYRELYARMATSLEEIEKYKLGGADAEVLEVFDLKTLKDMKNSGALDELESNIKSEQHKIAELMREEKYGADSVTCVQNVSMFSSFMKQKNVDEAYKSWSILFRYYPCCSQNIYSNANAIITAKMKAAKDRAEQERWIDTLMMAHDMRMKYFAEKSKKYGMAYCMGRKGVDYAKYRGAMIENCYDILTKAVDLGGNDTEFGVIQTAMKATVDMFNQQKIDASVVVDKYLQYTDILSKQRGALKEQIEKASDADKAKLQKDLDQCNVVVAGVDLLFSGCDAAKCEVLDQAFSPRFKENPNDIELQRKIMSILVKKGCDDLQLYEDVATKLVANDPSELACYSLGRLLDRKKKYDEAIDNYNKAIDYSTVDTMKALYNYQIASIYDKQNKYSSARTYAYKATSLNPNLGLAYLLVGSIYMSSAQSLSDDAFQNSLVYCLAIDKFTKAKSVDPSLATIANKQIGICKQHCPKKDEAFFHSLTEGQSTTIGGWINESTTVKLRAN